ncbi:MAG: phosphatidate cytidylyltransferase, partial [Proteobacteria bacterium]|nr:phosphatidate cytidylyltransferase [Pseudomonadota bacterium]
MLKTRIITAVVSLLALGAVLFLVPPRAAEPIFAALILAGAWEWSGFLGLRDNIVRSLYVGLIAALMVARVFVFQEQTDLLL